MAFSFELSFWEAFSLDMGGMRLKIRGTGRNRKLIVKNGAAPG